MNMQLQVLPDNDTSVIRGPVIKKTGWPRGQWSGTNPTPDCFPFSGVPGANYELYKQYGCERYVEMLHIINEAWKGNVDSNPAFEEPSMILLEQIFTIDKSRIERFMGYASKAEMLRIDMALLVSLALNVLSGNRSE